MNAYLIHGEDKKSLEDLAKGEKNILIVGNDKEMNALILKTIINLRIPKGSNSWYFKSRDDLDLDLQVPIDVMNFGLLPSNVVETKSVGSFEEAIEIVRASYYIPIVIDEINTHVMSEFFVRCCVGMRDKVTATYYSEASNLDFLKSFAVLNRGKVDLRSESDLIEHLKNFIKTIVFYKIENGHHRIYI